MEGFLSISADCNLSDLGFIGTKYTWTNCRGDGVFIKERLDHVIANTEWCNKFQVASCQVLVSRSSDHKSLIVDCMKLLQE
jgi:endonuclease/exonuclease/phosphatase (EEP) superfamily protein YafD